MVRLILWLKSSLEGWLGGNVTKEKKKNRHRAVQSWN